MCRVCVCLSNAFRFWRIAPMCIYIIYVIYNAFTPRRFAKIFSIYNILYATLITLFDKEAATVITTSILSMPVRCLAWNFNGKTCATWISAWLLKSHKLKRGFHCRFYNSPSHRCLYRIIVVIVAVHVKIINCNYYYVSEICDCTSVFIEVFIDNNMTR